MIIEEIKLKIAQLYVNDPAKLTWNWHVVEDWGINIGEAIKWYLSDDFHTYEKRLMKLKSFL